MPRPPFPAVAGPSVGIPGESVGGDFAFFPGKGYLCQPKDANDAFRQLRRPATWTGCSTKRVPANCSRAAGSVSCRSSMATALRNPRQLLWDGDDSLYVHCAPDGRKLPASTAVTGVSFCVVGATEVCPAQFTTAYESIVLDCRARRGLPPGERMRALELLLEKYSPPIRRRGCGMPKRRSHVPRSSGSTSWRGAEKRNEFTNP